MLSSLAWGIVNLTAFLAMMTNSLLSAFPVGLYGITPEWADTARLLTAVEAAHAGGMQVLQYRRKQGSESERQAQLHSLSQLCQSLDLPLLLNDHWQWASQYSIQGVHLGKDDGSIEQARLQLGPTAFLGSSCYNSLELAQQAWQQGANYVAFGAVYPSSVKPDAPRAQLSTIRAARQWSDSLDLPIKPRIVAIGGINVDNATAVIQAGAHSLAVISGLFEASDVRLQAQRYAQLFAALR